MASQQHLVHTRSLPIADAELVARIRAGSESAFETLHASYHDALWRFAHDLVRSPHAAEEIVQDSFLALWRTRAGWEISTSIAGWLYGAVRHHALRHQQRERTVVRIAERSVAHGRTAARSARSAEMAVVGVGMPAPDAHELDDTVTRALAALPERRRLAMTLRWKHQLSAPEIAGVLGTTPEAVRVLLARARRELVGMIQE